MQAGAELRGALNLQGPAAHLIAEHSQAAHILAVVYVAVTAVLIVTFAAQRISGGMPTGLSLVDRPLAGRSMFAVLRVLLVLLSIGAGVMTFRVGDLGAKAVWQGRIQAAQTGRGTPSRGAVTGGFRCGRGSTDRAGARRTARAVPRPSGWWHAGARCEC